MNLIISPHADDAILGCHSFVKGSAICFMAIDESYLPKDPKHRIDNVLQKSEIETAYKSAARLDTISKTFVNYLSYFKYNMIMAIESKINALKPDTVLIPFPSYNQDHQTVYESCMVALRPHDKNHFVKNVLLYEVYDYTNWGENQMDMNYFKKVDIDQKIKDYKMMRSQVRSYRSPEDLKRWAESVGKKCKMKHAEGFKVLRCIGC